MAAAAAAAESGKRGGRYRITALPVIWMAQLFAAAAIALMLIWISHFREGFSLKSNDLARLLNAHHVLMLFGPIICVGQAIMALKMVPGRRKWKKTAHVLLNLMGVVLGVLGLYAIFTVIKKDGTLPNFDSLHSWIGFGTMCLYSVQNFGTVALSILKNTPSVRACQTTYRVQSCYRVTEPYSRRE